MSTPFGASASTGMATCGLAASGELSQSLSRREHRLRFLESTERQADAEISAKLEEFLGDMKKNVQVLVGKVKIPFVTSDWLWQLGTSCSHMPSTRALHPIVESDEYGTACIALLLDEGEEQGNAEHTVEHCGNACRS